MEGFRLSTLGSLVSDVGIQMEEQKDFLTVICLFAVCVSSVSSREQRVRGSRRNVCVCVSLAHKAWVECERECVFGLGMKSTEKIPCLLYLKKRGKIIFSCNRMCVVDSLGMEKIGCKENKGMHYWLVFGSRRSTGRKEGGKFIACFLL